jgi:hypothetical protein
MVRVRNGRAFEYLMGGELRFWGEYLVFGGKGREMDDLRPL